MRRDAGQISDQSKTHIRRELRSKRSGLPSTLRFEHDHAIGQHFYQLVKTHNAHSIACFWPFDGEPDITPVYQQLISDGCTLALPVISRDGDHSMRFHSWSESTEMGKNRYGIPEPIASAPISISRIDMLVMPLVGYDHLGNRLGMGAGYYDRYLEPVRTLATPLRVGIAYSIQKTGPIITNPWDISLHGIVNERGWFTFVGEEPLTDIQED